jgi:hypothetical protein
VAFILAAVIVVAVVIVVGALIASDGDAAKSMGTGPVGSPDGGLADAGADADATCGDGGVGAPSHCPPPKLVSITVIQNATQNNVTGAKTWAAVKKSSDDVIVQATTTPKNDASEWNQITWSGDSGTPVAGKPNQRQLPRAASKKYHVQADLGGVSDSLDVWIIWSTVTILTTGTTPPNAPQNGARYDGTENLGSQVYNGGAAAVGKIIGVATITPAGANAIVQAGWKFRRERMSRDWNDGVKNTASNYWNTTWIDDTSYFSNQKLTPDSDDKIYDRDAPNIAKFGTNDSETYNNFREWTEWNGDNCSDRAGWYWKGRWQASEFPQVTFTDVGTGNVTLPDTSFFHP